MPLSPASPRLSPTQQHYANLCRGTAWKHGREGIVIALGPRGTGKTTIACQAAIDMLRRDLVERIVLARPGARVARSSAVAHSAPLFGVSATVLADHVQAGRIELLHAADVHAMQGRTMDNTYLVADDVHRTTPYLTFGLLMCAGQACRIVVTGSAGAGSGEAHRHPASHQAHHPDGLSDLVARIEGAFETSDEMLADIVRLSECDIIRSGLAKRVNWLYTGGGPRPLK